MLSSVHLPYACSLPETRRALSSLSNSVLSSSRRMKMKNGGSSSMEARAPNNEEEDEEALNFQETQTYNDEIDSTCSTPFVSAPSSPSRAAGQNIGFYYSAPSSPMHFINTSLFSTSTQQEQKTTFSSSPSSPSSPRFNNGASNSFEFDFSARFSPTTSAFNGGSMSSADELFLNGHIRPMKLKTHLQKPQNLAPLMDLDEESAEFEAVRGRDMRSLRDKSLRRRTRSLSPLRNDASLWQEESNPDEEKHKGSDFKAEEEQNNDDDDAKHENLPPEMGKSPSAASSRSSSAGRNSKRWVFLKDFLRSKSEGTGRSTNTKFWSSMSFSPAKEKKPSSKKEKAVKENEAIDGSSKSKATSGSASTSSSSATPTQASSQKKKLSNGVGKRRVPPSPHELHYTANRAQAEELRKKTYLPYRQGLLGCLGFSSKGYGAMNGFARALNPVSSR